MLHKSHFSSTFSQTPNKYKSIHKDALRNSSHALDTASWQPEACMLHSVSHRPISLCWEFCSRQILVAVRTSSKLPHCHLVNMDNMFSAAGDKHHDLLCPGDFSKSVTQPFGKYTERSKCFTWANSALAQSMLLARDWELQHSTWTRIRKIRARLVCKNGGQSNLVIQCNWDGMTEIAEEGGSSALRLQGSSRFTRKDTACWNKHSDSCQQLLDKANSNGISLPSKC